MIPKTIRVLLVDDDEEDYLITTDTIAEIPGQSYEVVWKDSFDAALEALATQSFDVLVFDYRLGAKTGLDLLRAVNERGAPAPVILLTGQHDDEIDSEAIRMGAMDYLIKGKISPDTFERSVRHAIEHFQTLTRLRSSNAFLQSIIDALTSEIAILNSQEEVLAVNKTWRGSFGESHPWVMPPPGDRRKSSEGAVEGRDTGPAEADALIEGVRRVIRGETNSFYLEYPCVTTARHRWVIARVSRFSVAGESYVVVAYEDITVRKLAELALEENRALLEDLSIRDELTQLYNRRYLMGFLTEELARSLRDGRSFAVLMLDIDHFKSVNDTYGHGAGDDALRHTAQICSEICRATDRVARFGGEEIVFVLPDTGLEHALLFAERVRTVLAESHLPVHADDGATTALRITASIGVAVYPSSGDSIESLLAVADKGLYQAKALGRNRVCFSKDF